MTRPRATYRLQFREGMDFERAAGIVPYLARLGISHLYASPIFTATSGSTHGYDVTDCNELDPALGGREGFERLSAVLKQHGLGLVIDIVPNHMAASMENPWWRDVAKLGRDSAYARHFDIDWSRRLTLPILDKSFGEAVEAGDIRLAEDEAGETVLAFHDHLLPLAPGSYTPGDDDLSSLHDRQHWQLIHWKEASRDLSYRRFFEVTGLVGLRMEDDAVFDDAHRLTLELVRGGKGDGLRIDHVDGMADPGAYLRRLRREVGPDIPIFVEKIIEGDERLPEDWPVEGTTGYEFIPALADFLVDPDGVRAMADGFEAALERPFLSAEQRRAAKRRMVFENFEGELETLVRIAADAIGAPERELREAIGELLMAYPVYRSYARPERVSKADEDLLARVSATAKNNLPERVDLIDAVVALVAKDGAEEFQRRFQQLSGPIMAKSIEDTLFYRDHRMIALNEVGGEPEDGLDASVARGHKRLARLGEAGRRVNLLATATHDTKRGEDARARLYALSEGPGRFVEGVARWRALNSVAIGGDEQNRAPRPSVEWMLYQALLGAWPHPADREAIGALEPRFLGFVEKALREAKLRTGWSDPDTDYEQAVADYAQHLLSSRNTVFFEDFTSTAEPFIRAGRLNALTQLLVKLTAPGVPDIYQGSEAGDFSLVDPDNRRPPDFEALAKGLTHEPFGAGDWAGPQAKQRMIALLLAARKECDFLLAQGDYRPVGVTGDMALHAFAYARDLDGRSLIVVAPRLAIALVGDDLTFDPAAWGETVLDIDEDGEWTSLLDGRTVEMGTRPHLADLLAGSPMGAFLR